MSGGTNVPAPAGGTDYTSDSRFIACWMMENSGDLGNDDCSQGSDFDLTNSGSVTQDNDIPSGFSASHKSGWFPGTDDWLTRADGVSGPLDISSLGDFAGGCWWRADSSQAGVNSVMANHTGRTGGWNTSSYADGSDTGRTYVNNAYSDDNNASSFAQWYYTSFNWDGTDTITHYLFGHTVDTTIATPSGTDSNFRLGASGDGDHDYAGEITHCWLANADLTSTEHAEIFLCGLEGDLDGEAIDAAYGTDSCTALDTPWECCTDVDAGCVGCDDIDTCC
jgi:hypothetical protein